MRKSIPLLLPAPVNRRRPVLLLLALFTGLGFSATAQENTSPPLAVRTPAYIMYAKSEAPVVKEEPSEVTIPVKVTPNPSAGSFRARLYGSKDERVRIEILDRNGRIIDTRQVPAESELRFGYWYRPGTYFLRIVQGDNCKKIKLEKMAE